MVALRRNCAARHSHSVTKTTTIMSTTPPPQARPPAPPPSTPINTRRRTTGQRDFEFKYEDRNTTYRRLSDEMSPYFAGPMPPQEFLDTFFPASEASEVLCNTSANPPPPPISKRECSLLWLMYPGRR